MTEKTASEADRHRRVQTCRDSGIPVERRGGHRVRNRGKHRVLQLHAKSQSGPGVRPQRHTGCIRLKQDMDNALPRFYKQSAVSEHLCRVNREDEAKIPTALAV